MPKKTTKKKRFKCDYCDKSYASEATLKRHIKEKHPDKLKKKQKKTKKSNFSKNLMIGITVLVLAAFLIFMGLKANKPTTPTQSNQPNTDTGELPKIPQATGKSIVNMELYVMSHCPYGTQAENGLLPVVKQLGSMVDLDIEYIGGTTPEGFQSLHGENEVKENIVQLCALNQNKTKALDFILCRNKQLNNDWKACAAEAGLDAKKIEVCANNDQGKQLLTASFNKSRSKGISGSPTIFINGESYSGPRDESSFARSICDAINKTGKQVPEYCSNIPKPRAVHLIVLNDKRCNKDSCDTSQYIRSLKYLFPGLQVKELDYNTEEGKKLFNDTKLQFLPVLLFEQDVKEAPNYQQIERWISPAGDYLKLAIKAEFDPTAEICDNSIDDDKDGKVDCQDDECKQAFNCNKRAKPNVELFVMSYCPYGTQTEKAILPVVELLGDKIEFNLRFVYYAMHGEIEVKEELRQYCIQSEQRDKFLAYLRCFLEDGNSTMCVDSVGIDTAKLDACIKKADAEFNVTKNLEDQSSWLSNRFPLVNFDRKLNEKYNVRGSPSLAINGLPIDSFQRTPASLLDLVCQSFIVKPSECSQQLSTEMPSPGFGWSNTEPSSGSAAGGQCS